MAIVLVLLIGFLGFALILALWVAAVYNRLVRLKNQVKNAWTQIDVQLKRRYDLIPNLVETAKGYLKHERETLEAVIQARNQAMKLSQLTGQDPLNTQAALKSIQAESFLGQALSRLMVVSESYPDLKANQNMLQVSEELTSTENKISFARQAYNDTTTFYNTRIESFPDNILAGMFNFKTMPLWEIESAEEKVAPKVSFN